MRNNDFPKLKPDENGNVNVNDTKITGVLPYGDTAGLRTTKKKDKLFCFHKDYAVKHDGAWLPGIFDIIFADHFNGYPDFVFRIRFKGIKDG